MTILTNLALFTAFEQTSIAIVLICFYTFPVMVAVAAVRVYGEPLTPDERGGAAAGLGAACCWWCWRRRSGRRA